MTDINQCESFFLQPICEDEIRNLINNLDTHKATSPDDIPVLVLKNQQTPASSLYKSFEILALENMIKLTLITIAHSFHHKTLLEMFDNLFKYLKTSHSYNTQIRSNQNFFKPSVYTNIGKKSI